MLSKRRFTYEQEIATSPLNYDAWFDYIKLEESTGNVDRTREVSSKREWAQKGVVELLTTIDKNPTRMHELTSAALTSLTFALPLLVSSAAEASHQTQCFTHPRSRRFIP